MHKPYILLVEFGSNKLHVPMDDVNWEHSADFGRKIFFRVVYEKPAKVLVVSEKDICF
ncbi:hypothetical protein MHBO_004601 [Bonamia ostreae]|uniref:Uncharacterized protein n=1 Tax=Bonamia ostreae TaxID=126728 RepID=A0ABV2AUF9_9EUKA